MKKYISGQITGLTPDVYHENFRHVTQMLEEMGHEVVNPLVVQACVPEDCNGEARLPDGKYFHSWQCYLKHDIIEMLKECDTIVMLPNWQNSQGAGLELYVAARCGLEVWSVSDEYDYILKSDQIKWEFNPPAVRSPE